MKKIIQYCLLSLVFYLWSFAPHLQAQNLPYIDSRALHLGFFLGLNTYDFGIAPSLATVNGEEYAVVAPSLKPGFTVGVITDLRLGNYWNLRINPSLNFAERELLYKSIQTGEITKNNVLSVPLCLPMYLKYSSERLGNFRPYLLGGGGGYLDLARDSDNPVLLRPFDCFVEIGVGCDIYFPFFKLAPELRFGFGFTNLLTSLSERTAGVIPDSKLYYSTSISRLTTRMLTLVFNFE